MSDLPKPAVVDEQFDVVIVRFDAAAKDAVEGLQRLFSLEPMLAIGLLEHLPATVRRNVNRVRAEYFRRALVSIGAHVEIRTRSGSVVADASLPAGLPTSMPAVRQGSRSVNPTAATLMEFGAAASVRPAEARRDSLQHGHTLLQGAPALSSAPVANDVASEPSRVQREASHGSEPRQRTSWGELDTRGTHRSVEVEPSQHGPQPDSESASGAARRAAQLFELDLPGTAASQHADRVPEHEAGGGRLFELDAAASAHAVPELARDPAPRRESHGGESFDHDAAQAQPGVGPARALPGVSRSVSSRAPGKRIVQATPSARAGSASAKPRSSASAPAAASPASEQAPDPARDPARRQPRRPRAVEAHPQPSASGPVGFWEEVSQGLSLPWQGGGIVWFSTIVLWTALGCSLATRVAPGLSQLGMVLLHGASVALLCFGYARACMRVARDDTTELEGPLATLTHGTLSARTLAHAMLFAGVLQFVVLWWWVGFTARNASSDSFDVLHMRVFWALTVLPALYWPAAIMSSTQSHSSIWSLRLGIRIIVRAPLEYLAIVFFASLGFALPWLLGLIVVKAALGSTASAAAISGAAFATLHGVLGGLCGLLLRARSELLHPGS